MSIFFSNSPKSGTLVSKVAAPRQVLAFLYPIDCISKSRSRPQKRNPRRIPFQMISGTVGLEAWFFSSIATAGHCRKHHAGIRPHCSYFISQRSHVSAQALLSYGATFRRHAHTKAFCEEEAESTNPPNTTREELLALVDQYSGESFTDQLPLLELPTLHQPAYGPYLTVSDKEEDEWPPPYQAWPADPETKDRLKLLEEGLRDFSKDPEEIYQLYRALPKPRAPYLESKIRHRLLRHLSVVERKDNESMLRYFSVVDDMKDAAIPLSTSEWTSAISFAARYVSQCTELEVEAALKMWIEMEHSAGVKGSSATFNVLFDVASKAGKFTLAEMIYKELEARGLRFERFHHVSLIYFHGLRGNGDGARAAYKSLVDAGEIVDTVVLNAMISALVRSHEAHAAENIYERMKQIHEKSVDSRLPPKHFKARRYIERSFIKLAKIAKSDSSGGVLAEYRHNSILTPDLHTYRILIQYFAIKTGELDKVTKYLDDMHLFEIPPHGALFLAILKGFALHGGIRYTQWTDARLEGVWRAFLKSLDLGVEGLYVSRWIVVWALKAFLKCSGKSRTLYAWEEIRQKWEPSEEDMDFVMKTLRPILEGDDAPDKRPPWTLGPI